MLPRDDYSVAIPSGPYQNGVPGLVQFNTLRRRRGTWDERTWFWVIYTGYNTHRSMSHGIEATAPSMNRPEHPHADSIARVLVLEGSCAIVMMLTRH